MDIKKIVLLISISMHATNAITIGLPDFATMRPLIAKMAQASKHIASSLTKAPQALYSYMRNHKVRSILAIASGLIMTYPETRKPIVQFTRRLSSRFCAYLGRICHSPRLINTAKRMPDIHDTVVSGNRAEILALAAEGVNLNSPIIFSGPHNPLQWAASMGKLGTVQALIDAGVNIETADTISAYTSLHYAALRGHVAVVKELCNRGANKEALDHLSFTPLHIAIDAPHPAAVIRQLCGQGAFLEARGGMLAHTPLLFAAFKNVPEAVQALVDLGADVNAQDKDQSTALRLARNNLQEAREHILLAPTRDADFYRTTARQAQAIIDLLEDAPSLRAAALQTAV